MTKFCISLETPACLYADTFTRMLSSHLEQLVKHHADDTILKDNDIIKDIILVFLPH